MVWRLMFSENCGLTSRLGKYETMGSLAVSSLLVAGAVGIGLHSLHLLMQPSMLASILDPKAAWFAFASVVIKEWLYRASK